jgi:hypothetical protein
MKRSAISLKVVRHLLDVVAREGAELAGPQVGADDPAVVASFKNGDLISLTKLELIRVTRAIVKEGREPKRKYYFTLKKM